VGELVTFEELNEAVTGLRYGGMSMRRLSDLEDARTD
jgi:hypothetical protein